MLEKKSGNLKKILSNISWMLFDRIFILILNLVVTVRIANYYGSLGYGTYQYAVSIVAVFEILAVFVDSRVVKRRYLKERPKELVWNATVARALLSVVALLCGVLFLFLSSENSEFNTVFFILLVNSLMLNLRFGMQNRYEYLLQLKKVIIANNISLIIGGVLQLIAIYLCLPIFVIAFITALSSFLSLLIVYKQYNKDFGTPILSYFKEKLIKEIITESVPLAIAASCAIIYLKCDSIMIGNILSKESVGVYAIALKLVSIIQMGLEPIRESVYPKMIELHEINRELYAKNYVQITSILTWIYIVGVLLSFIIFPYIIHFLKPEYAEALPIYKLYVIGAFFMYNAGLRAGHYTLINRGKILMYSQIICVVLNLVLNFIFINNIGIYGAALATGVTQCVSLLVSNLFFGKTGKEVFIWQIKGLNPLYIFMK